MTTITDAYMKEMLPQSREYTIVLLRPGPGLDQAGAKQIIWEHGRRNFALRADGVLAVVCPVTVPGNLSGLGIFTTSVDDTRKIMDEDPGVQAGLFSYEAFLCRGFPGDALPAKG